MAARPVAHWKSGLFDCFEDASTCCYGFWCCPCLTGTVSGRFGENRCLPLCDLCSTAISATHGIPLCVSPAVLSLRAAMRNRYGIKGSIFKDIAVSCFCSWCQMHRELKHRAEPPTVFTVLHQTVMQMQPAPVVVAPVYPAQTAFVSYPGVMAVS